MIKGRKASGGKYKNIKKKKLYARKGLERRVKLKKIKKKIMKGRGGILKTVLLAADYANIFDPKTKKAKKVKILNVIETPSNRFLARQNILVKSAIIETELGKAKITNRPSQESMIQAVLMQ